VLKDDRRNLDLFRDAQAKSESYRQAEMIFAHDPEGGGTIGPVIT
jgi:hypothetical protein